MCANFVVGCYIYSIFSSDGSSGASGFTVIPNDELQRMLARIDVLENTSLQNRLDGQVRKEFEWWCGGAE
jgi:hypothetical protein